MVNSGVRGSPNNFRASSGLEGPVQQKWLGAFGANLFKLLELLELLEKTCFNIISQTPVFTALSTRTTVFNIFISIYTSSSSVLSSSLSETKSLNNNFVKKSLFYTTLIKWSINGLSMIQILELQGLKFSF
ncbi:hypothetical protein BpHYR1_042467 [Brachionus plicatilis]|uniref:Uncharacterized protein n=1 Tax=Brachionus plicatilis TaxID=10195 RepID=A0A3M7S631_BRAPC|nr:hypothetical protein BpHYR1_042467 [Brachionus plicatilis]